MPFFSAGPPALMAREAVREQPVASEYPGEY